MKPQLIAKRNAELRRKAEAEAGARRRVVEPEIQHNIGSDRSERVREVTVATSQSILGIVVTLIGLVCFIPAVSMVLSLFHAGPLPRNGPTATQMLLFVLIFGAICAVIGIAMIRVGIGLLRAAWFQGSVSPGLRALQKLSFDAMPVTTYVVGDGAVTNQVLLCFDHEFGVKEALSTLAAELSDPEILAELVGEDAFVDGRRR